MFPSRRTTAAMQRGGTDGVPAEAPGWWEDFLLRFPIQSPAGAW
jgi:hypothetical protein